MEIVRLFNNSMNISDSPIPTSDYKQIYVTSSEVVNVGVLNTRAVYIAVCMLLSDIILSDTIPLQRRSEVSKDNRGFRSIAPKDNELTKSIFEWTDVHPQNVLHGEVSSVYINLNGKIIISEDMDNEKALYYAKLILEDWLIHTLFVSEEARSCAESIVSIYRQYKLEENRGTLLADVLYSIVIIMDPIDEYISYDSDDSDDSDGVNDVDVTDDANYSMDCDSR